MAYTEFYCDPSTGDNMNGGAPIGGSYPFTYTNGGWNSGTGVFTPASGNPQSDGVTVGDFAAVFQDGSTTPSFVGRVTARNTTTITVSTTVKIGTTPITGGSGLTCKVGGAWKGPNGAATWPVGSITATLKNASNQTVRVNLKNNATYAMTAALTQSQANVHFEGYSSSVGDGGRATIDGSTNTIVLWTNSGGESSVKNIIFSNNGTAGTNAGLVLSGEASSAIGCVVHDIRGIGISCTSSSATVSVIECECYACNTANTASSGGLKVGGNGGVSVLRSVFHDNTGSNNSGAVVANFSACFVGCIFDSNVFAGLNVPGSGGVTVSGCDFYSTGDGVKFANSSNHGYVENSNFIKCATGIACGNVTAKVSVISCGFGTGTQANTTADTSNCQVSGSVNYASNVTPWVDPANGDFRINLAAAIAAGRGAFTQTAASYAGSSSSPVIGACQVADYPAESDVTNTVQYANGAYTGTASGGGSTGTGQLVGGNLVQ